MPQDQLETSQIPSFTDSESRVLTFIGSTCYLGKEKINPEVLRVLKDQAENFKTTELYEFFRATVQNEASNLALIQATNWESVQFAKALWHWQHVLDNILQSLTENK